MSEGSDKFERPQYVKNADMSEGSYKFERPLTAKKKSEKIRLCYYQEQSTGKAKAADNMALA